MNKNRKYIIFGLDDTLIYEIDFLKSAYQEIANMIPEGNTTLLYEKMIEIYHKGGDVFGFLEKMYPNFSKEKLLEVYRNHFPFLTLNEGAKRIFKICKTKNYKLGLITDGRSITQRNKLKALNIEDIFDRIVISEEFGSSKPDKKNFLAFQNDKVDEYFYIADNPEKDFITPNKLGWTTVCLIGKGKNIHKQDFTLDSNYLPKMQIENLKALVNIIF